MIHGYGDGGFRIAETRHMGSVIVFWERTVPWAPARLEDIDLESLAPVAEAAEEVGILLIGCGPKFELPPTGLKTALKDKHGLVLEWMDTGAACRTFNVLLMEERPAAAALVAV